MIAPQWLFCFPPFAPWAEPVAAVLQSSARPGTNTGSGRFSVIRFGGGHTLGPVDPLPDRDPEYCPLVGSLDIALYMIRALFRLVRKNFMLIFAFYYCYLFPKYAIIYRKCSLFMFFIRKIAYCLKIINKADHIFYFVVECSIRSRDHRCGSLRNSGKERATQAHIKHQEEENRDHESRSDPGG